MSASNADVIEDLLRAYNARDLKGVLAACDPEIEWHTTDDFPWPGVYRGHGGITQLFTLWWRGWEPGGAEEEELLDRGDRLVWTGRLYGRSGASGQPLEIRYSWVFWMRDAKIWRADSYKDHEEALRSLEAEQSSA